MSFAGGGGAAAMSNLGMFTQGVGAIGQAYGAYNTNWMAKESARYQDSQNRYGHELSMLTGGHAATMDQYDRLSRQAYLKHQEAISDINAERQKADLQTQAVLARLNARRAQVGKRMTLASGDHDIARYSLKAGNVKASQRARLAANGVVINEGSAAELQDSADIIREIDVNTIKTNSMMEAWGYDLQAMNYENQAGALEANASGITGQDYGSALVDTNRYFVETPYVSSYNKHMYSPGGAAFTSLMGSANTIAGNWYSRKQVGI